jgi:drug/metabolite transporter (DMT)-like permease
MKCSIAEYGQVPYFDRPFRRETMQYIGELAALSTALFWSFTAIFFSEAGKLIGSFHVNKIRLVFAFLIYVIILLITTGYPLPTGLNSEQIFWLTLSALIGLVIGDGCGFKALVMIGPRLATLIMASTPIMATVIAWIFLGEKLKAIDLVGIFITIGGISWVISERTGNKSQALHVDHPDAGTLAKGILLALVASLSQATGLVFSKKGMMAMGGTTVPPLQASCVRITSAMILIWLFSIFARGKVKETLASTKDRRAMAFTFGGAFFGPFLGVWMSLVAVAHVEAGIAATLNATTPVLIIPAVIFVYKEKISWRAIAGAVVAVAGVAMLFLG